MAAITAQMVKDLRETTGAGMMDCKAALQATDGDMEAAIDWLRKKGLAKAAKKAGRAAAEGLVVAATKPGLGVLVEVNSETDFVARNETFQKMAREIADVALGANGDVEAVKASAYPGAGMSVADKVAEMVGQIGENMNVRRAAMVKADGGVVAAYIHNQTVEGAGKIGVLVGLKSSGDPGKLNAVGKQIAMHVAAARPLAGRVEDLDPAVVAREKSVLVEQARASGKPDEVVMKMVEGRLRKFYEESVLLEQIFVIDGETKVAKVIENAAKQIGSPIEFTGFARLELGEGVEKTEEE
ncbi:MAG TPA: elongation factor Ts [Parvularcula sp.]|nr:elongation factor Ts [Parvularcula sp.]HBS30769.1 elongation factor Ts [Parvularcula sp.]HBS35240.1 elongation factor Ts [Parvularcula sp.]